MKLKEVLKVSVGLLVWIIPVQILALWIGLVGFSTNWLALSGYAFLLAAQMIVAALVGASIAADLTYKRWTSAWNGYLTQWKAAGLALSNILEAMFNMMNSIYQENVTRRKAFNEMLKGLGVDVTELDKIKIPEGMEDFCVKGKL